MVEYIHNEPPYYYQQQPSFIGGILMLDARETFEKYERRSPQPTNDRREYFACEYRRETVHQPVLTGDYRNPQSNRLACEYKRDSGSYHPENGTLACELRARPSTTVTTFVPETNKKKFPFGMIIGIAICIPVFIVIVLFAAVWLQEVGII